MIVALQTLPVLLLGPYGGVIADRVDKRRLMVVLQSAMGVQALILGLLTVTGAVQLWEIGVLAALLGLNNAFENPARQSFMLEMVGAENLRNAVSLNSVLVNVARAVGPAVAGLLIATVGDGVCFLVNAASFVAVVDLARARSIAPRSIPRLRSGGRAGSCARGSRYVARTPRARHPAADDGARRDARLRVPGVAARDGQAGAALGRRGLRLHDRGDGRRRGRRRPARRQSRAYRAARRWWSPRAASGSRCCSPRSRRRCAIELVALALVGWASITFMSTGNSTLQLGADPAMRGRVMSLWFVAFQGSTPIGGPLVGRAMAVLGPRAGLGIAAATAFAVALLGIGALRWLARRDVGAAVPA